MQVVADAAAVVAAIVVAAIVAAAMAAAATKPKVQAAEAVAVATKELTMDN